MHPSGEQKHIFKPFLCSYSPALAHICFRCLRLTHLNIFPAILLICDTLEPDCPPFLFTDHVLMTKLCTYFLICGGAIQMFKIKVSVIHTIENMYLISNLNADKIKVKQM